MGQNEHFVHPISLLQPGFQVPNTAQRAGGHGGFRCRVVNIKSLAMLVAADGINGEIFDRSLDTNHSKQTVTEPIWQQPHDATTNRLYFVNFFTRQGGQQARGRVWCSISRKLSAGIANCSQRFAGKYYIADPNWQRQAADCGKSYPIILD